MPVRVSFTLMLVVIDLHKPRPVDDEGTKMPADETEVHSAAEILLAIDELVEFQKTGMVDVTESVSRAIMAFDDASCENHEDALAFIAMSRRLTQYLFDDALAGRQPDEHSLVACDRYMERALAFLRMQATRERYAEAGQTLH